MVGVVAHLVDAVLEPLLAPWGPGSPLQSPLLWTMLAFARNEFGRFFFPGMAPTLHPRSRSGPESVGQSRAPNSATRHCRDTRGDRAGLDGHRHADRDQIRHPAPLSRADVNAGPRSAGPSGLSEQRRRDPAAPGGQQFFGGGPVADSTLTQTVDLSAAQGLIDAGDGIYTLRGDLGGFLIDPSRTTSPSTSSTKMGSGWAPPIKPVTAWDRLFATGFIHRDASGAIPVGPAARRWS